MSIVLGSTGLVTSDLVENLEKLGIEKSREINKKCQEATLLGTIKTVKNIRKMKN